jgi:hypothetical protein
MAPEDPLVSAMLLCEHVHADSASGKHTLFGVFDEVQVSRFPVDLGAFAVYLNLTNLRGRYDVDLLWLRGDTEEELARLGPIGGVEVADPLSRVELVLLGQGLAFPFPGRYVLRHTMNRRHLQDYVIIATESPE